VRVELDEDMPVSPAGRLGKLGVDAETVYGEGLAGRSDPEVLAAASAEGRMVFTLDRAPAQPGRGRSTVTMTVCGTPTPSADPHRRGPTCRQVIVTVIA
jgi:hypothetical protein